MSKLNDYLSQTNCVLVNSPSEVNLYLGDLDVIAYEGAEKELFRERMAAHKAAPVSDARRYKEYDFGGDVVVYSSLANIVDLVEGGGTTRPPETVVLDEASDDTSDEASDDDAPPAAGRTWF